MQRAREQTSQKQALPQPLTPVTGARLPRPVRVIAGADVQDLDLGGRTVAEARLVAQALFGVNDDAAALIDGRQAGEDQVVGEGQLLEFVKHAGQKGALLRGTRTTRATTAGPVVELAGDRATWRRNGRALETMPLTNLLAHIEGRGQTPHHWRLYPRQVRLMAERRRGEIVGTVIEMPPGPRQVRWITDDSTDPFGPHSCYEQRHLSFPWVVLLVVFVGGALSNVQQAFYRTSPIQSLTDELYYTNLLNVAEGHGQDSWVCLVNMPHRLEPMTWEQRINAVTEHFWHAAFTRSSEVHEGNSYWTSVQKIDTRFASAAAWEAATQASPYFTLEVRWRRTGQTLGATLEHMLDMVSPYRPVENAAQVVTLMQQSKSEPEARQA